MNIIENITDKYKSMKSSTRRFIDDTMRWLAYYKLSRKVSDFDYEGVFEVERFQIKRLREAIEKSATHTNAPRDIQHMNIALRLLDIVQQDGCSEYHGKDIEFDENGRIVFDKNGYYTIPVYVNTRNAKRFLDTSLSNDFMDYQDPKRGARNMDVLRVEKAWVLYHMVKAYFMRSWWD